MPQLIFIASLALAQTAMCPARPHLDVALHASHTGPQIARESSVQQLEKLARAADAPLHHAPLGVYVGQLTYRVDMHVDTDGQHACPQTVHLNIQMHLGQHLGLAKNLPTQSCVSAATSHYEEHAKAGKAVFDRYVRLVHDGLADASPSIPRPENLPPDRYSALLARWVGSQIEGALRDYDADLKSAATAVDSPRNDQRIDEACGSTA